MGRLDEHSNQDQDQDEDQDRKNEGPGRGYGDDGGRRGFRHLIPELVHHDADCSSRHHSPSVHLGKRGVASSLMDNGHRRGSTR